MTSPDTMKVPEVPADVAGIVVVPDTVNALNTGAVNDPVFPVVGNGKDPLEVCGLTALDACADLSVVATSLRRLGPVMVSLDPLERRTVRNQAITALKARKIADAAGMVDAALLSHGSSAPDGAEGRTAFADPVPWSDSVNGAELLSELAAWLGRYVHVGEPAAINAVAAWIMAAWAVDHLYFAPLLVVWSPTKRAGKTTLLDLLHYVVRRPHLTSGLGASPAVIFRLNDLNRPTFLVDEAERLSGRDADKDLVALLNQGHRRGGVVSRCVARPDGGFDVKDFDAFGFRTLALIGRPWDTLRDRAVMVHLERKPRNVEVARFASRIVAVEGQRLARRLARWAADHGPLVGEAEATAPRPGWLDDRACDNWAPLFGVAAIAGGPWPVRLLDSARVLRADTDDETDRGERLVRDVGRIFTDRAESVVLPSGELKAALNDLEEAPWGDERGGGGISTHRLAALLRPFGVRPRHARRPDNGSPVRGYWWSDFEPVASKYSFPTTATSDATESGGDLAGSTVAVVALAGGRYRGKPDPDELAREAMREGA